MKIEFRPPTEAAKLVGIRQFLNVLQIETAYVTEQSLMRDFRCAFEHTYGNARLTLPELAAKLGIASIAENARVIDVLARMREARA